VRENKMSDDDLNLIKESERQQRLKMSKDSRVRDILEIKQVGETKTLFKIEITHTRFYGFSFANGNEFRAPNSVRIISKGDKFFWDIKKRVLHLPGGLMEPGVVSIKKEQKIGFEEAIAKYNVWRTIVPNQHLTDDEIIKLDEMEMSEETIQKNLVFKSLTNKASEKKGVISAKQLEIEKLLVEVKALRNEVEIIEKTAKEIRGDYDDYQPQGLNIIFGNDEDLGSDED
jgi:hypothetical protein